MSTFVLDSKLILLSLGCFILIWSASRICNFCLLFYCSNIVVFSVRIFQTLFLGRNVFFRCGAIELVSDRWLVSRLDKVVEVKLMYIQLFSEIQSPKAIYTPLMTMCRQKMFILFNEICNRGSIPGRVIPKIQMMVLDAALLKIQ